MKLIAAGTLSEGFQYHGPFADGDPAIQRYSARHCDYTSTDVVSLIAPNGEEFSTPHEATIARLRAALTDVEACVIDNETPVAERITAVERLVSATLRNTDHDDNCEVVIIGNAGGEGFKYFGPFLSTELALAWADRTHPNDARWVVTIIKQED